MELKYSLLSKIGSGSYGEVWEAVSNSTGKKVALKIQKKDVLNTLKYEAKVLLALKGTTCVPPMYSVGRTLDGRNYVAMKLYDTPLIPTTNPEKWRFYVRGTFDALWSLHSIGYVHRDVKPENFMMGTTNDKTSLVLIDLGMTVPMCKGGVKCHGDIGTSKYMASDVGVTNVYGYKSDWESWILTCISLFNRHKEGYELSFDCNSVEDLLAEVRSLNIDCRLPNKHLLTRALSLVC